VQLLGAGSVRNNDVLMKRERHIIMIYNDVAFDLTSVGCCCCC